MHSNIDQWESSALQALLPRYVSDFRLVEFLHYDASFLRSAVVFTHAAFVLLACQLVGSQMHQL